MMAEPLYKTCTGRGRHVNKNAFAAGSLLLLITAASAGAATRTVVVPAGTPVHFKLLTTISTATARPAQSVPAQLTAPIVINGITVARAGAPASAYIRNAESSGRIGGSAKLSFSLTSIRLANGSTSRRSNLQLFAGRTCARQAQRHVHHRRRSGRRACRPGPRGRSGCNTPKGQQSARASESQRRRNRQIRLQNRGRKPFPPDSQIADPNDALTCGYGIFLALPHLGEERKCQPKNAN